MGAFEQGVIFFAAMLAGAVNAVAGGGTVFSFTALVWAGLPLVQANATNATALVPGSLASAFAYRYDLAAQGRTLLILLVPTIAGSLLGAFTVANTSEETFRRIVPFLVLFATLVFAGRNFMTRLVRRAPLPPPTAGIGERVTPLGWAIGIACQFLISIYGGYFGAGIGILMLTSMSIMGMTNIHRMNALKALLAVGINGTAAVFFILAQRVNWPVALVAALGALIGGYFLARWAKRVDQDIIRGGVVVAGLGVSAWMFLRLQ